MIRTINYQGILQSKKTVLFWYKDRPMEQIESSEIDLCVYGNLIYDKCGTTKKNEKNALFVIRKTGSLLGEKAGLLPYTV